VKGRSPTIKTRDIVTVIRRGEGEKGVLGLELKTALVSKSNTATTRPLC